jgi:FMN phosphatase YigB (HAD superfamily)
VRTIPHPKHPIQHLLIDLDGTLIHSGSFLVHLEFIARVLPVMKKHQGWKSAWNGLMEGFASIKMPSTVTTNHVRLVNAFEKNFKLPFAETEKQLAEAIMEVFPKLKSHFGQIEGAAAFVKWAKEHYTLTVATNPVWLIELVHLRMRWGGIDPKDFGSITTADRMHATKPHREYFDELLKQENFKAENCLFIGNDRKMDLPANRTGIPAFLIRPDARRLSCLIPPSEENPGAWRGNYRHLQKFLNSESKSVKS